jgi:O-antigen ligase
VIALAIPLSISRTAVVGLVAAAVVLLVGWPARRRLGLLALTPAFLVLARFVAPGTLGTLASGLLGLRNDPSFQGRTQDYDIVGGFISERPVFGRGLATLLPDRYLTLDNQYLGIVVELGLAGLVAVIGLLLTGFVLALLARSRSDGQRGLDRGRRRHDGHLRRLRVSCVQRRPVPAPGLGRRNVAPDP